MRKIKRTTKIRMLRGWNKIEIPRRIVLDTLSLPNQQLYLKLFWAFHEMKKKCENFHSLSLSRRTKCSSVSGFSDSVFAGIFQSWRCKGNKYFSILYIKLKKITFFFFFFFFFSNMGIMRISVCININ
jgi:hypothetical protein